MCACKKHCVSPWLIFRVHAVQIKASQCMLDAKYDDNCLKHTAAHVMSVWCGRRLQRHLWLFLSFKFPALEFHQNNQTVWNLPNLLFKILMNLQCTENEKQKNKQQQKPLRPVQIWALKQHQKISFDSLIYCCNFQSVLEAWNLVQTSNHVYRNDFINFCFNVLKLLTWSLSLQACL